MIVRGFSTVLQVFFIQLNYQTKKMRKVSRNTLKTSPRNLTHPILVKKSYLYLGTPPLIAERKTKHTASLLVKINVWFVEYE